MYNGTPPGCRSATVMKPSFVFVPYSPGLREACFDLFDANCPEFFHPREREDYEAFLAEKGDRYEVCFSGSDVAGAFGLIDEGKPMRRRLSWILVHPSMQRIGLGTAIVTEVRRRAAAHNVAYVDIAASHKSCSFFARFGARDLTHTPDGWGPGMHRVDMELAVARARDSAL